jgi:hypothetical protein
MSIPALLKPMRPALLNPMQFRKEADMVLPTQSAMSFPASQPSLPTSGQYVNQINHSITAPPSQTSIDWTPLAFTPQGLDQARQEVRTFYENYRPGMAHNTEVSVTRNMPQQTKSPLLVQQQQANAERYAKYQASANRRQIAENTLRLGYNVLKGGARKAIDTVAGGVGYTANKMQQAVQPAVNNAITGTQSAVDNVIETSIQKGRDTVEKHGWDMAQKYGPWAAGGMGALGIGLPYLLSQSGLFGSGQQQQQSNPWMTYGLPIGGLALLALLMGRGSGGDEEEED